MAGRRDAYAYILRNPEGAIYVGATRDICARLAAHNAGRASNFTRSRPGPWAPIHLRHVRTFVAAQQLEAEWTLTLHRTGTLSFLRERPIAHGPAWHPDHALLSARRERRAARRLARASARFDAGIVDPDFDDGLSAGI